MRMMLKASFPAEASNRAIHNGSFPLIMEKVMAKLQPEAVYFMAWQGKRTMLAFFDLQDPAMIPQIAEPLFSGMNSEIEFIPVMNQAELQQGLAAALAT
ncbi:MAG TPA: hypothetical protein VFZ34_20905 [Blastocatellia bacterium]|nr:hypothetical protein [Blastocatellia bacterium]